VSILAPKQLLMLAEKIEEAEGLRAKLEKMKAEAIPAMEGRIALLVAEIESHPLYASTATADERAIVDNALAATTPIDRETK
jgi:hypothetical protein